MELFALGWLIGSVFGLLGGFLLSKERDARKWRESAEFRRHVGEYADPNERT